MFSVAQLVSLPQPGPGCKFSVPDTGTAKPFWSDALFLGLYFFDASLYNGKVLH